MSIYKIIISLMLSVVSLISTAQSLEIKSLDYTPTDLSGSTKSRKDLNGNYCALVKVEAPGLDLYFQGNIIGDVERKASEYWCYLTEGTIKLKILTNNHEAIYVDFSPFSDKGLLAKQTYVLKIKTSDNKEKTISSVAEVKTFNVNNVKFQMVKVSGGSYTMGATQKQIAEFGKDNLKKYFPHLNTKDHYGSSHGSIQQVVGNDEKPAHTVVLDDFYIATTEVTQELWQAVMGKNPSKNKDMSLPVTDVTWHDCQKFIKKLNKLLGLSFRLPTEAEWEYAARGGRHSKNFIFSGGDILGEVAWCYGNSQRRSHSVGMKKPNELGLYDMSGNVSEWCNDWHDHYYYRNSAERNPKGPNTGDFKVVRGGNYSWQFPSNLFTFSRDSKLPDWSDSETGLRLAL